MSKTITFDECIVCPHQGFSDHEAYCWRTNRAIDCKHETSIPEWCPLPDTQEQGWRVGSERYEKIRRMNPRQFAELYNTNLTGLYPFDDLVDSWPNLPSPPEENKP